MISVFFPPKRKMAYSVDLNLFPDLSCNISHATGLFLLPSQVESIAFCFLWFEASSSIYC